MTPLAPSMVYYYYFSSDDMDEIRGFKDTLKKAYGLDNIEDTHSPPGQSRGFKLVGSVHGGQVSINTLIWKNITLVEVILSRAPEEWSGAAGSHSKAVDARRDGLTGLLGEGIVFVAPEAQDLPEERVPTQYSITEDTTTHLKAGTLHHLLPMDKDLNLYGLSPKEGYEDFILGDLPFMDLLIHKLDRQTGLYLQRMGYMKEKRGECDEKVERILGRTMIKDMEKRQEALEGELAELSTMYSSLAMDTSFTKKALNSMEDALKLLDDKIDVLRALQGENGFSQGLYKYRQMARTLEEEGDLFRLTLEKIKDTLDVVGTRVGLLSSREQLAIQKERYNLQAAAGVLEVIIVLYYSMMIWKSLAPEDVFHHIPYYVKFWLMVVLSFSVFLFTHHSAHAMAKEKRFNKGMGLSLLAGAVVMALVYLLTFSPYHV